MRRRENYLSYEGDIFRGLHPDLRRLKVLLFVKHMLDRKKSDTLKPSVPDMLKSSEVVGQMKLQRRYAKVHQHSRKGRREGWMVHAAPHFEFHMLLVLQTDT